MIAPVLHAKFPVAPATPATATRKAIPEWQLRSVQCELDLCRRLMHASREAARRSERDRISTMPRHGAGEGRAANRTFIDRAPTRPSYSRSAPMIAFADECWRLASRTVARALGLVSRLRDVIADVREIRRKLEAELFHNRYRLVSKNDDDLPIVR
jgi:hypothetical protein